MVIAALASLQRISSDVNGLSVAIDNVNMRQAHFESVQKAGGRITEPTVECGELNTKSMAMASNKMSDAGSQTDILGDSEGCLSGSKLEHTDIAASDLFNSPIVQNLGFIDLVESPRRVEVPSQPEEKTVVICPCSNSVRSRGHGRLSGRWCGGGPRRWPWKLQHHNVCGKHYRQLYSWLGLSKGLQSCY